MTVNKVILVGRLGRDPEVRYTNTGLAIANVSLATSTVRKDKNTGERTTETEWHRVVFFERLAEICEQYLKKGSQVYLEGKLKTRKYTGQDGIERYATEVHADTLQMLGSKDEQQSNNTGGFEQANKTAPTAKPAPTATTAAQAKSYAAASGGTVKSVDELEDDIPF